MNSFNVISLINTLNNTFKLLYQQATNIKLYELTPLYNGYCLYYAKLLYDLIPGSQICHINGHYFIMYDNNLYDFRGLISSINNISSDINNESEILIITDVNLEFGLAELVGIVDQEKDLVWSLLEPSLLEEGKIYLKDILGNTRQKKDTRH